MALHVGCGTGCFVFLLESQGVEVIGLEPARASLDFARSKPLTNKVRWILGDATSISPLNVDLAVMTGNVAQVFLTDKSWEENLVGIRKSLRPNGHLVFEVRNPAHKAWLDWNREKTYSVLDIPGQDA